MSANFCGHCGSNVHVIKTVSNDPKVDRLWCRACSQVTRVKKEDPLPDADPDLEAPGYGFGV